MITIALNGASSEYLHTAYPARIKKIVNDFARELDFKDTKFPVKIRDIQKFNKKKNIQSM